MSMATAFSMPASPVEPPAVVLHRSLAAIVVGRATVVGGFGVGVAERDAIATDADHESRRALDAIRGVEHDLLKQLP